MNCDGNRDTHGPQDRDNSAWPGAMLAAITAPTSASKDTLICALPLPADGATWDLPAIPARPGRPADLRIGPPPRRRRGLDDPASRRRFLHAIWHIELSAVDLACLTSLHGSGMPSAFHADFKRIACEEAFHADLIAGWLAENGFPVGSDPVHHRLWDAALAATDLGELLVVIPRFLEARGLDVTAELLPRIVAVDPAAHAVLARIYQDEINHVGTGTRWHAWWCARQGVDPQVHFATTVRRHFSNQLPSPFALDHAGRAAAGFTAADLAVLTEQPG